MAILGEQLDPPAPTADHGAARINRIYNQICMQVAQQLSIVKGIADHHGRTDIDTAMGADASEFASFYAAAKTFAETHPDCTVEDLPS